ncbi:MAG TPA: cytochrome c [Terriglobales bacterium]|jgi:mono/diheme cytochrome c family protein|nr:cytochrome c [Terriglobales bacterium]
MSNAERRNSTVGPKLLVIIFTAIFVLGLSITVSAQDAPATFKTKCAMCHGADASGNTTMGKKFNIPDLRAPEIQKKTKAELGTAIAKGKNKMPAFEGKITADQVNELAAYVHQLKK